jgi:hypothetical protein
MGGVRGVLHNIPRMVCQFFCISDRFSILADPFEQNRNNE